MQKSVRLLHLLALTSYADHHPVAVVSVADVKGDSSSPKGSSTTATFNRSLLILTPHRALRFTAMTQERHEIWFTALGALADPVGDLAPLFEEPVEDAIPELAPSPRISEEAAEPPQVPRAAIHSRKRSSSGPRMVQSHDFAGYSGPPRAIMSNVELSEISDAGAFGTSRIMANGAFDAVSTVRMEAFIAGEQEARWRRTGRESGVWGKERRGKRKDMAYFGVPESAGGNFRMREDPFGAF